MSLNHIVSAAIIGTALIQPVSASTTFNAATHSVATLGVMERSPTPIRGSTISCGTHFYDDGSAENALFFEGGGHAGEADHFFGVKFVLDDFNLIPGTVQVTGFCAGNSFDLTSVGGPWPNEVFVYPDILGLPNLDRPLQNTTMLTGDGSGDFIASFDEPVVLNGDFWLLNRGFPAHEGEDFNMETDQDSPPLERSYLTDRGLPFLFQTDQNLILRAFIELAPNTRSIPTLSIGGYLLMMLSMGGLAFRRFRNLQQTLE